LEQVQLRKQFEPMDKEVKYLFSANFYIALRNMGWGSGSGKTYPGSGSRDLKKHQIRNNSEGTVKIN
jgi:hypothetical protein